MGVNNRQRRAAKKKHKDKARARPSAAWTPFQITAEQARSYLLEALQIVDADPAAAATCARTMLHAGAPVPPGLLREALHQLLAELTGNLVRHGWRPTDLAQLVQRRLSDVHVAMIVTLVTDETRRHRPDTVGAAWRDDLSAAGRGVPLDLSSQTGVAAALELTAALAALPAIAVLMPPPGTTGGVAAAGQTGDPKLLARVRALLAKAESTEFDEEAEALSAKAQELISRHALDRLLLETDRAAAAADAPAVARRIWIDAPYVFAKSMLVHAVADANRCRSVVSEKLGFCTVLGQPGDLVAVDVLVTSLLVQASSAMRRHGRQTDHSGTSRTKSFRQSFLVSYASRIHERLRGAADEAVRSTGRSGELVPVLRRQAEQVDAATEALFPHLVTREAAIRNAQGWAAGRAAADLAQLDTAQQITEAAS